MTRRILQRIGLALIAGVAACGDFGVPLPDDPGLTDGLPSIAGTRVPVALADTTPYLETYEAAFWAVQGRRSTFRVNYVALEREHAEESGERQKHLVLTIPRSTQIIRPDGSSLAEGDSIQITVTIDGARLAVEFGPDGTRFAGPEPLHLALWLVYADLTQGSGPEDLHIWYRPPDGATWEPQPTRVIAGGQAVLGELRHFSNYAVAY